MIDFREQGVSTVLVSHNLDAIEKSCSHCLWMDHGKLRANGPVAEVVAEYRAWVIAQNGGLALPASGS